MFYKVIKNNRVIDVLDRLVYLKYQKKYNRMLFCDINEAQAILSSNQEHVWHVDGLYNIPADGYDTVELVEIDQYEYEQLKAFEGKTPEEYIDNCVLQLVNGNTNWFTKSLKRLYDEQRITLDEFESMKRK